MRLVQTLMLAVALVAQGGQTPEKELEELKLRIKERYATLVKLKDAGKLGETWDGQVDAVKPAFKDEKADPTAKDSDTIKVFLEKENKDRLRLYELLAKGMKLTAAEVGIENGKRNFKNATAEWFVKPQGKDWVKKKDFKPDPK